MRFSVLYVLLILSVKSFGQNKLSSSLQSSVYTYIYEINRKEALELYKTELSKVNENYLHSLVDSFLTDRSDRPFLRPGNYLIVHARQNRMQYQLQLSEMLSISFLIMAVINS